MEDSLSQSPVRDFRLRRRSPLKSQTYRTLYRLLSLFEFDDKNQPPRLIKFAPYQLPPGSLTLDDYLLSDAVESTNQGIYDHGEMGDKEVEKKENTSEENGRAVDESLEGVGLSDRVNCETRMMLDEIADTMSIDDDDGGLASKKKENIAEGINRRIYLEDIGSDRERMILDELTTILNEDFAPHRDDNSVAHNSVSLNESPCGDAINELENKQVEHCSLQHTVVNDLKEVALMLEDGERSSQNVSATFCFSPGSNALVPQRKERDEIENSLLRKEILGVEVEGRSNSLVASADSMLTAVVDEQMEEGELSDGFEIDVSAEANIEISQLPDEKDGKGLLPEAIIQWAGLASGSLGGISNVIDNKEEKVTEADGGNVVCGDGICNYENTKGPEVQGVGKCDKINEDRKCELKQRAAMKVAGIPTFRSNSLVFYGDILEQNEVAGEGRASVKDIDVQKKNKRGLTSDDDFDGQKKTKRGPVSQARKEKKKKMDRMKRAEKNRELGVKRLKLQPIVQKPKPIALCRHYIRGRCHEGEKCKFSHNTIPLTKSKPCSHFARHSCMKGDDCPFDHQLSKYPCSNFVSKGYCSRGDSCLFSHKIPAKEDSTLAETNVSGPESRPPVMPNDIGAVKRPSTDDASDKAAGAVLDRLGISFKSIDQIMASSLGTSPVKKPNFGSYPARDLAVASPRESTYNISSSNQRNEGKANNHVKESSSAGSALKAHESVRNPTLVVPKGINFLTFASPLESGYSSLSSKERDEGKLSYHTKESPSTGSASKANESVETPPFVVPKGINFRIFTSQVQSGYSNSSMKGGDEGKLNNQAKESSCAASASQTSESVQNPPLMVPKGIIFQTFGRSLLGNTSSELQKSENVSVDKGGKADGQNKENGSEMVWVSKETPAKAQSSAGSQEHSDTISRVPNNGSSPKQVTASSRVINIDDRFAQGEQINKLQNSSEKVSNLPTFPSSSLQHAGISTPLPYKSKLISAQKILSSTLAFAARCEKEMTIRNHSSGDPATCSATNEETSRGYEQNDSARAIKILDFLSSIGQKKV